MASYLQFSRAYHILKSPYSFTSISNFPTHHVTLCRPSHQDYQSLSKNENNLNYIIFRNVSIKSSIVEKGRRHGRHLPNFAASGDMVETTEKVRNDGKSWIDLYLPEKARPYAYLARLSFDIGSWLTAWPSLWSVVLAAEAGKLPDFKILALFTFLAFITRGIACTVNDYLDRDLDEKVERTKFRPLVTGAVTPFQAICFLSFQVLLGFGVVLPLNGLSRFLWTLSLIMFSTYPLMKRITYWPQAFLGLAMSFGNLYGWSAVKGSLDPSISIPLYLSGVCWPILYDTIYAHQDREDDMKAGVKSTAVLFGDSTKKWISGFGFACITGLALAGYNANIGWIYYAFLGAASSHLVWQILTVDLANPADCLRKFVSNKWFGAIVFTGILLGRLIQ